MTDRGPTADQEVRLIAAAREASTRAYARYSGFPVGAAILTGNDRIFAGCNVENASFGLTCCAERNAVFAAIAAGERQVRVCVVYTPTEGHTAPCGACRQVLHEFSPDASVISVTRGGATQRWTLTDLLPAAFGPSQLPPAATQPGR